MFGEKVRRFHSGAGGFAKTEDDHVAALSHHGTSSQGESAQVLVHGSARGRAAGNSYRKGALVLVGGVYKMLGVRSRPWAPPRLRWAGTSGRRRRKRRGGSCRLRLLYRPGRRLW